MGEGINGGIMIYILTKSDTENLRQRIDEALQLAEQTGVAVSLPIADKFLKVYPYDNLNELMERKLEEK